MLVLITDPIYLYFVDDVIDRHDGTAQSMEETQYWSQNGVHFNSWGGVLRINRHDNQTGDYSEIIVIPGETYEGPDFDTDMGGCCGGDGGDHGGDEPANMGMMVTDNATFLDIGFSWDIFQDAGFANADVDEYEVILAEVDAQGEPISALIAHFDNTVSSTTIDDMLNGTNGATNNTATVLAEVNAEDGSSIVELTGATLLESKTYIVFVEAYDAQGNTLGESDDIALDGATP